MSEQTASGLATELRSATLDLLWRQWKVMGGTVSADSSVRTIIDPEALILMSLWMMEDERRLADVVWSWVSVNHNLVSYQRLGNLRDQFPLTVQRRLSSLAVAQTAARKRATRWRTLRANADTVGEPFPHRDRVRAVTPRHFQWASLVIQLRLGLGVGVKADALALLLGLSTHQVQWTTVSAMAETLGYTSVAVRRATDDMARARFVKLLDTPEIAQAAQRMFSAQPGAWINLLQVSPEAPGWGYWRERYRFLGETIEWLDGLDSAQTSAYARDVHARKLLQRHSLALRHDRVVDPQEFAGAELGYEYLVESSRALMIWIRNRG